MYCLSYFCCCCLKKRKHLTNINTLDADDVSFKDKFTFCELETIDDDIPKLLCQKCCKSLQFMYQFRRAYLNRQKHLKSYITKLKTTNYSNIYSTLSIDVINVDPFIPVYNKHNTGIDTIDNLLVKEEPIIDDFVQQTDAIKELSLNVDIVKNPEIINNDERSQISDNTDDFLASEESFVENNNYEIVKNPEPEIIDNSEFDVINGGNNVLKIVRKKDDSLKITFKKSSLNETNAQPNFQCIFCDSSFHSNKLLRKHERTHNNQSYKCKICSRIMYNKYTYRIHFGKHSGEYKYRCNICNKGLSSKHYLMKHNLIHYKHVKKLTNKTVEKAGITPEKDQFTLENNFDNQRKKVNMSPIRINIKRNQIISNTAVTKRGRPKIVQCYRVLPFECAMCQKTFSHAQKLFRHLKLMHNCA